MSIAVLSYRNNIEAAWGENCGVALQVVLGARQYARLFSAIDTFRAASVVSAASQANFDKGDERAVLHHQIDFTVPATVVPSYQPQALIEQMPASEVFGPGAAFHCACARCAHCCIGLRSFSRIRGVPLLNRAHMSRRSIRLFSFSERAPVMPLNSA